MRGFIHEELCRSGVLSMRGYVPEGFCPQELSYEGFYP